MSSADADRGAEQLRANLARNLSGYFFVDIQVTPLGADVAKNSLGYSIKKRKTAAWIVLENSLLSAFIDMRFSASLGSICLVISCVTVGRKWTNGTTLAFVWGDSPLLCR